MSRPQVGSVILVTHSGEPTVWSVKRTGEDDRSHLLEIFETAVMMCQLELLEGGTLRLLDADNNVIKEQRGITTKRED